MNILNAHLVVFVITRLEGLELSELLACSLSRRICSKLVSFLKSKIDYIILFVISVLYVLVWFHNGSLAFGGDKLLIFHPENLIYRSQFSWNHWADAGSPISNFFFSESIAYFVALRIFGLDLSSANKLYLIALSWASACFIYYLTSNLYPQTGHRRLSALFSSVAYLYSPARIVDTFKSVEPIIPFVFLPLFLALVLVGVRKRKLVYALFAGLVSFPLLELFPIATWRILGFLVSIVFLHIVVSIVSSARKKSLKQNLGFLCRFYLILSGISFLINLHWIVPFIQNIPNYVSKASAFAPNIFFNQWATLLNVFRLLSHWGFYNGYVPYASVYVENPFMILLTCIIPILAFSAILLDRSKATVSVTAITLVTIFLAKGNNPPFGSIYESLAENVFLKVFYSSSSIVEYLLPLEYSVLIGATCGLLINKMKRDGQRVRSRSILTLPKRQIMLGGTLLVIILLNAWPLLTGSVFINYYKPSEFGVKVPDCYFEVNDWLEKQHSYCKTVIVPPVMDYIGTEWGFQGTSSFYQLIFTYPVVTGKGVAYGWLDEEMGVRFIRMTYDVPFNVSTVNNVDVVDTVSSDIYPDSWASWQNDTLSVDFESYPRDSIWNKSLAWDLNFSAFNPGFHQISYQLATVEDWSGFDVLAVWMRGDYDPGLLDIGVGDKNGLVGWYASNGHTAGTKDEWKLLLLPLRTPDKGAFNKYYANTVWFQYFVEDNEAYPVRICLGGVNLGKTKINSELWGKMVGLLGAKYVMVDGSVQTGVFHDRQTYIEILNDLEVFSPVKVSGLLSVFENKRFSNLVYAAENLTVCEDISAALRTVGESTFQPNASAFAIKDQLNDVLIGSLESAQLRSPELDFIELTPTRIAISTSVLGHFILVFSEEFHQDWKAYVDGKEVSSHFIVNGFANGWLIDQTGTFTIVLEYSPQIIYHAAQLITYCAIMSTIGLGLAITISQKTSLPKHFRAFRRRSKLEGCDDRVWANRK